MLLSELLAIYPQLTPPNNNSLARKINFFDADFKPNIILSIPAFWLESDYQDESLVLRAYTKI